MQFDSAAALRPKFKQSDSKNPFKKPEIPAHRLFFNGLKVTNLFLGNGVVVQ